MGQRAMTGIILLIVAIAIVFFGRTLTGITAMMIICCALHEEYKALRHAGHSIVSWPTWLALACCVPLTVLFGSRTVVVVLVVCSMLTITHVIFRPDPKLEDILMSLLPMLSVMVPGLCIVALAFVEPFELSQSLLLLLVFVPVASDTFAYWVGSRLRGPKLCPAVSPNKTISGSIGGIVGAVLFSVLLKLVLDFAYPADLPIWVTDAYGQISRPGWISYLTAGILGGLASQMGDLFASLVKRHAGIKDFSNLFPGHGGMLDRMDSVLFMAPVIFAIYMMKLGFLN